MKASDLCMFVLEGRDRGNSIRNWMTNKSTYRQEPELSPQERTRTKEGKEVGNCASYEQLQTDKPVTLPPPPPPNKTKPSACTSPRPQSLEYPDIKQNQPLLLAVCYHPRHNDCVDNSKAIKNH